MLIVKVPVLRKVDHLCGNYLYLPAYKIDITSYYDR